VYAALCWLKDNNPIYSNITISNKRLNLLPENDIPMEIIQNICQSDDVEAVVRKHEGYVPVDVEDGERLRQNAEATDIDDLAMIQQGLFIRDIAEIKKWS